MRVFRSHHAQREPHVLGRRPDAAVFRDFVMRYVAANHRAASPKFLFGESYGTPRSAVLANLLESAGTSLHGVVLPVLGPQLQQQLRRVHAYHVNCAAFLPSYAAVGAWLDLATPPPARFAQLPAYMAQMRTVAATQYDPAVRALPREAARRPMPRS